MSRRMKFVFTVSLVLNVLLLAAAIGGFARFRPDMPPPEGVSPEAQAFMMRTFKEGRPEIRPLIDTVKERRKAVEAVIEAPEFDPAAYRESVDSMLDARDAIARKKADVMGRAIADLPPADRQAYSRAIIEGFERPKGRRPAPPVPGEDKENRVPGP